MKLVALGVFLCVVVLFVVVRESECDDKQAELPEQRRAEEKQKELQQQQTLTLTAAGAGEQNGPKQNTEPQTDPHR